MPENNLPPTSMPAPSSFRSWLSGNRKMAILLVITLFLLVALGLILWRPWAKPQSLVNAQNKNTTNSSTTNGADTSRTFERFQATVNRHAPLPVTNIDRPTKEDTAKAIQDLQTNTNTN